MLFLVFPVFFQQIVLGSERAEGLQVPWNNMFQSRILLSWQLICSIPPLHSGRRAICPWKLVQCQASFSSSLPSKRMPEDALIVVQDQNISLPYLFWVDECASMLLLCDKSDCSVNCIICINLTGLLIFENLYKIIVYESGVLTGVIKNKEKDSHMG